MTLNRTEIAAPTVWEFIDSWDMLGPMHQAHYEKHALRDRPAGVRVLVVEDDEDMCETIREILTLEGFDVDTADNGQTAVSMASGNRPYDVVVSDIRLPRLDGFEVARAFRALPHPPRLILITAYPEWYDAARRRGENLILTKPLSLRTLVQAVRREALRAEPPQEDKS